METCPAVPNLYWKRNYYIALAVLLVTVVQLFSTKSQIREVGVFERAVLQEVEVRVKEIVVENASASSSVIGERVLEKVEVGVNEIVVVKNASASFSSAVANGKNATVSASPAANGKDVTASPITLAHAQKETVPSSSLTIGSNTNTTGRCAINLYGLPRSFKNYVLPSLIRNVIEPNLEHECDYFLHYYRITKEKPSGTTKGGRIFPDDVFLLENAVHDAAAKAGLVAPHVGFRHETEENFQDVHRDLNDKIKDESRGKNKNKYQVRTYTTRTTLNVVKMWHSQSEVWRLMEEHAKQFNKTYTRVAMFRSDVVFVTPIDIFRKKNHDIDYENRHAVIPYFGKFPVNDRMIHGPYEAVKMWATERLPRVHEHVKNPKASGLHSEKYLKQTIFPLIRELGFEIQEDRGICFFRCRADGPIHFKDCEDMKFDWSRSKITDQQRILEDLLGQPCKFKKKDSMYCNVVEPNITLPTSVVKVELKETVVVNASASSSVIGERVLDKVQVGVNEIVVKNASASSSSAVANGKNATVSASSAANGKDATASPITLAHEQKETVPSSSSSIAIVSNTNTTGRCAINLYGLPRSFKNYVLPSLIRNVIEPNLEHECDFFLHYYRITKERPSKTTKGGAIFPDDVFLLENAVHDAAAKAGLVAPHVGFRHETEENFQDVHRDLNDKIKDESRGKNKNKYQVPTYGIATTLNVVKMWHSQSEVWRLMEEHAKQFNKTYTRVAMFRSDVVFVTPIDIFRKKNHDIDYENRHAVIPYFGKFPVNDRMIHGPYEAVKMWATERLPRVHEHVQKPNVGGLHSERYLKRTIFPLIRELGFEIQEDRGICFFRCRADGPIHFTDCEDMKFKWSKSNITDQQRILEDLLGQPCKLKKGSIHCNVVEPNTIVSTSV